MNILFVTTTPLEYSSSANVRNIALIKGLLKLGNQVSTCTAKPEIDSSYYDNSLLNIELKKQYYIEISKVHSKLTSKSGNSNSLKKYAKTKIYKLYNAFSIYDPRKNLLSAVNDNLINDTFDLIISSSDPKSSHLLAEKLLINNPKLSNMWLQYWGDPFTNDINNKSILPKWLIKREELRIIEKCNAVIYVSPFTLQKQIELFPEIRNKIYFLPVPYIDTITKPKPKPKPKPKNLQLTLGYFGDYYSSDRNILPLYMAVKKSNLKLQIYGNSDISLEKNANINVSTRIKYEIVKEKEQECDLLICICNKVGTQIPGKVYHYAATNKPVLIVLDGEKKEEMRSYFESFERYLICENNPESITQAINSFMDERKEYSPSPFFAPITIAKKVLDVVNTLK